MRALLTGPVFAFFSLPVHAAAWMRVGRPLPIVRLLNIPIFPITIIALLAALTSPAPAQQKLPDSMLGAWCGSWGYQFPDSEADHFWRIANIKGCANRGGIRVRRDGWDYYRFGWLGSCRFTQIKFSRKGKPEDHVRPKDADGKFTAEIKPELPSDEYLIYATCKHDADRSRESFFVQTTDDWLIRYEPRGAKQ